MQIFNSGDAEIQASKTIRRKCYVELEKEEGEMLLGMYPALRNTPSSAKTISLEVENAELKKKLAAFDLVQEVEEPEPIKETPKQKGVGRPSKKKK